MNKLPIPLQAGPREPSIKRQYTRFLARAMGGKQGTIAAVAFFTAGGI